MRVRVDAEHAAKSQRFAVPAPVELEAPRTAVDFDGNTVFGARLEDRCDIDVVSRAAQKLAAGEMAEYCCEGVRDTSDNAIRLLIAPEAKAAMHAGDNKIEALQHLRRII